MNYRRLGRTGLIVSVLGLGTGGMNRLGQKAGRSREESVRLVRGALDLGINLFDTAPAYMDSEALLGEALEGVPREDYHLVTKFHPLHHDLARQPDELLSSLEESLTRLRTDYVDALLLHGVEPPRYAEIMDRFVEPLQAVKRDGLARFIGMSDNFERDVEHQAAQRAMQADVFDVLMIGFNMLSPQAVQTALPLAKERNVGVIGMCAVRSVISNPELVSNLIRDWKASGDLAVDAVPDEAPLDWLLGDGIDTLTDAAYKFAAGQPGVCTVLSGSANLEHLAANVRAVDGPPLAPDRVQRLIDTFAAVRRSATHPTFEGARG